MPFEHSSNHNWLPDEVFKNGDTPVCHVLYSPLHTEFENNVFPYGNKLPSSSTSFSEIEPESTEIESQKKLKWIDESNDILSNYSGLGIHPNDPSSSLEDVTGVRRRLEKRKRRNSTKHLQSEDMCETKRVKNTIAARRYREKRQKEVEILDKKVKELEHEVSTAKMETKWWQMEVRRWQELAEKREQK